MGVRLPPEYQEVSFLQSTGRQNLNTVIPMKSAYRVKYAIEFTRTNSIQQVFAAFNSSNESLYFPYIGNTSGRMYIGYRGAIQTSFSFSENTYYVIESELLSDRRVVTVNGSEVYRNTSRLSPVNSEQNMCVFKSNNLENPRYAYVKLYFLEVYDVESNEIIANFIPCYRKSDSEPGMYDLVSGTFFTNAGTGEFLVGGDVIDSISPWLVARRRWIMAAASRLIKRIATGVNGVVNFVTKVKKPMKVTCEFSPVQDLHGYSSPYPAGGSKNLIPDGTDATNGYVDESYVASDGTIVANTDWYISEYFPITEGADYVWSSKSTTTNNPSICFYDENKTFISGIAGAQSFPKAVVPPTGAVYCRASQFANIVDASKATYGYQLELGTTATTIMPYSNVCPIGGWTKCGIFHATAEPISFALHQEGSGTPSPENIRPIIPGLSFVRDDDSIFKAYSGTLTLNADGTSVVTETVIAKYFDGVNQNINKNSYLTGNWIRGGWAYASPAGRVENTSNIYCDRLSVGNGSNSAYKLLYPNTLGGSLYFLFCLTNTASEEGVTSSNVIAYFKNWFTENPVTFTYMPTTPRTYNLSVTETARALAALGVQAEVVSANWQSSAGTIYGGTVTLNEDGSADLVEDWYHFIVNGDTNKATSSSAATVGGIAYRRYSRYLDGTAKNIIGTRWVTSSVLCDGCKVARTVASCAGEEMFVYPNFNYWYVYIREDALTGTTADDFNAYMREHPIAISAKVESGYSTPNTYHFDSIGQLQSFLGNNVVWHDMNGQITVEYYNYQ